MANNRPQTEPQDIPTSGWSRICAERQRQQLKEGYTQEHDDQHHSIPGALEMAGRAYINQDAEQWPFEAESYKPRSRRDDLVRGAALLLAESDRLHRQAQALKRRALECAAEIDTLPAEPNPTEQEHENQDH